MAKDPISLHNVESAKNKFLLKLDPQRFPQIQQINFSKLTAPPWPPTRPHKSDKLEDGLPQRGDLK